MKQNLNRLITTNKVESVIKTLPANKSPGPNGFTSEIYQLFKDESILILLKLFQKHSRRGKTHKLILQGHNYPDSKTRQRHHRERKLDDNIPDEHRCKNPDEYRCKNPDKPNSAIYLKDHAPLIKWDLFLGCKFGSISSNQLM